MRVFRGAGGTISIVSERLPFTREPLDDAGDGFDWRLRDPSRRFWCDDELLFEASTGDDVWAPMAPLEVTRLTGRVGFARCLRGQQVRACGVCQPTADVGSAEGWVLSVNVPIADATTLESTTNEYRALEHRSATVQLERCTVEPFLADAIARSELLVRLPHGAGVIVGVGVLQASPDTSAVNVDFHEGKVSYVLQ